MFILFRLFVFFQVVQKQTFGEVGPWELEQSFDVKYSILNVCTKNKIPVSYTHLTLPTKRIV